MLVCAIPPLWAYETRGGKPPLRHPLLTWLWDHLTHRRYHPPPRQTPAARDAASVALLMRGGWTEAAARAYVAAERARFASSLQPRYEAQFTPPPSDPGQ